LRFDQVDDEAFAAAGERLAGRSGGRGPTADEIEAALIADDWAGGRA